MAGRASKMTITRASRVKTRGTSAHRIQNSMLFDLVRGQILPKMHVAPGNRDLLPFWAVFGGVAAHGVLHAPKYQHHSGMRGTGLRGRALCVFFWGGGRGD